MAVGRRQLTLAGALGWALASAGCGRSASPPQFNAIDITGADYARDFDLPDTDGRRRRLGDFAGKVTVVFFGYTQCPDVCPVTMAELAQVKRALGAQGQRVQGVFITVDPERDTPALLKAYVENFDPGFVALRGSDEETQAAARQFKVYYAKVPSRTGAGYSVDHTAGSFVFDARGRVRLFSRYGSGVDALKADLETLLAQA